MPQSDEVAYSELASVKVSATFHADPSELFPARHLAIEFFEGLGCPADLVECAALITSELASNSVRHAATDFTLTCETLVDPDSRRLGRISVEDGAAESLPVLAAADRRAIGGRGLSLISRLGSAWGVELTESSKTVWCDLLLDPDLSD